MLSSGTSAGAAPQIHQSTSPIIHWWGGAVSINIDGTLTLSIPRNPLRLNSFDCVARGHFDTSAVYRGPSHQRCGPRTENNREPPSGEQSKRIENSLTG